MTNKARPASLTAPLYRLYEGRLQRQLDPDRLPRHPAVHCQGTGERGNHRGSDWIQRLATFYRSSPFFVETPRELSSWHQTYRR